MRVATIKERWNAVDKPAWTTTKLHGSVTLATTVGLALLAGTSAKNPFLNSMSRAEMQRFGVGLERLTRIPKEMTDVRCDGINSAASRGSGAAYYWCKGVILGTPNPIGLSYGVQSWDTWSRYMAEEYNVPTRLFDCFTTSKDVDIPQYPVPHERFDECLDATEHTDEKGRVFKTIESQLASREPLSTFVKIDIEGMEWTVLEAMTDEQLSKIAILDLEIHWCLTMQTDTPEKILGVLRRLLQQFAVVGRLSEGDWITGVGCDQSIQQTTMMSVSYVNKAAMFGRIVKESTKPLLLGSVSQKACGMWDKNVTTTSKLRHVICQKALQSPAGFTSGLTVDQLVAWGVIRDGGPHAWTDHLKAHYGDAISEISVLYCGSSGQTNELCTGTSASEMEKSLLQSMQTRLQARRPLSVALMLDLAGLEWGLLTGLTDDDLDKIMSINLAMDFCSSTHSYQGISQVLRRLQRRFLVVTRDMQPGIRHRPGCLEGQQKFITVTYVNKRGRIGYYNLNEPKKAEGKPSMAGL